MSVKHIENLTEAHGRATGRASIANQAGIMGVFNALENRTFSREVGLHNTAGLTPGQPA